MLEVFLMSTILVIDPRKVREARGARTQEEIAEAGGYKFSAQQLSGWEKGKFRPRPENLPALLTALGVEFEQVASPLGAVESQAVPA